MEKFIQTEQAAHSGAFGNNPLPLPTDKQIQAGNYKKGSVRLYGLPIKIEQPRNSYRTGTDKNGTRWSCRLAAHYGYFAGTKGKDGDAVDCFIGAYPNAEMAFVINQFVNGKFDEHKVMVGFVDEPEAINAYQLSYDRGWQGLHSLVPVTLKQLKGWLKNGNMQKPLLPENLPIAGFETMNKRVRWGSDNLPENMTLDQVHYEMRRADADDKLLFDSVSMADIYGDDDQQVLTFDSLSVPFAQIERKARQIKIALDRAGSSLKTLESTVDSPSPQISEPIKKNGAIHIAVLFELTDGQTITIFFYNPDNDPSKLKPNDTMLAWKWLLNKKDITIVVAPERGKDLEPREVAMRVMKLAEKNSAAFTKANVNRAEKMKAIADLNGEIGQLESELKLKQGEYEAVKADYEDWQVKKAMNPVQPIGQNPDPQNQEIDPATLANLNAASISAAIKKKAIAFFERNPTTKSFEGSGLSKASQKAIMESIKAALLAEIKSISPLFKEEQGGFDNTHLKLFTNVEGDYLDIEVSSGTLKPAKTEAKIYFSVSQNGKYRNIFDSTKTLEDLRDWDFTLPFDLDVKAFVANVIKPVVDEFLSKQQSQNELEKNLPKNTIAGNSNDIANLAEKIVSNEIPANEKQSVRYAIVSDTEAAEIKRKTGLDVKGYKHTVDSFGIRHAFTNHGDAKAEALRGQDAVTAADIAKIPEIVATPDNVENGGKSANGNDLIRYSKRLNGNVYYVEEVRDGRMELVAITMWKTRTNVNMPNEQPKNLTPEATGGNLPHDEQNIAQPENNAMAEIDAEIKSLHNETDIAAFDKRLDDLANKIESAGLMEQYESTLNEVADILTGLLKAKAGAA
jgi:hypothetical protein